MERLAQYRINAAVCAAQANATCEPFKAFYEALELQWQCLARLTEREAAIAAAQEAVTPKKAA
jgi:hypothetical protein